MEVFERVTGYCPWRLVMGACLTCGKGIWRSLSFGVINAVKRRCTLYTCKASAVSSIGRNYPHHYRITGVGGGGVGDPT
jgi:hypothetical protein